MAKSKWYKGLLEAERISREYGIEELVSLQSQGEFVYCYELNGAVHDYITHRERLKKIEEELK